MHPIKAIALFYMKSQMKKAFRVFEYSYKNNKSNFNYEYCEQSYKRIVEAYAYFKFTCFSKRKEIGTKAVFQTHELCITDYDSCIITEMNKFSEAFGNPFYK